MKQLTIGIKVEWLLKTIDAYYILLNPQIYYWNKEKSFVCWLKNFISKTNFNFIVK